ncbi:flippase [archaeon]|jgi:O-antigen/teichoic acid export membrane protein|nr:flippase [archaeon]MBT3730430.1 flippase [archaeon]MBT4670413.1 flippase [archaeon]MBT5030122.1 flippase [archaeon]MBT5288187.1 flippase [archaeon]
MSKSSLDWIVRGAFFIFIGLFFSKLLNFAFRTIVARWLGPADYGILSLGIAVFSIVGMVASLGLEHGVERYLGYFYGQKKEMKNIIFSGLKIALISSLIFAVLLFLFSSQLSSLISSNGTLKYFLLILALVLPFWVLTELFMAVFRGTKKIEHYITVRQIVEPGVKVLLAVAFLYYGYSLFGVMWAYVLSYFVSFLVGMLIVWKLISKYKDQNLGKSFGKKLLTFSWPLLFMGALFTCMTWIDTLMIGYFLTEELVGVYNVAIPLAALLVIPVNLFKGLFIPVVSKLYAEKKFKEIKKVYKKLLTWFVSLTFPLFMFMFYYTGELIVFLFGVDYIGALWPMRILLLGTMVVTFFGVLGLLYNSFAMTKLKLVISFIATGIGVVLNIVFIQSYGITGAALATAFSFLVFNILLFVPLFRKFRISLLDFDLVKQYLKVIIVGVLSFFALVWIFGSVEKYSLILFALVYGFVYLLFLFLFGGISKEDMKSFKSFRR